jgi:hypothetical protein
MLEREGLQHAPTSRRLLTPPKIPSPYKKTKTMKLWEYAHNVRLEDVIFLHSINEFLHAYPPMEGVKLDRSTVSRWRTYLKHMKTDARVCRRCMKGSRAICRGFRKGCLLKLEQEEKE